MKKILIGLLALASLSAFSREVFTSVCEEHYRDLTYRCHYRYGGIKTRSLYLGKAKKLGRSLCGECELIYCHVSYGSYSETKKPSGGSQSQGGNWSGRSAYLRGKRIDKKNFMALRKAAREECSRTSSY